MGQLKLFKIAPDDFVNSFAGPKGEGQDARSNPDAMDGNLMVWLPSMALDSVPIPRIESGAGYGQNDED